MDFVPCFSDVRGDWYTECQEFKDRWVEDGEFLLVETVQRYHANLDTGKLVRL